MERDPIITPFPKFSLNFNSHAHVERDHATIDTYLEYKDFNSHAHVERDDDVTQASVLKTNFNSHAHVERDATILIL